MKYNFLKTSDIETKNRLLEAEFKLVSQEGNVFTFINDHSLTFEDKNNNVRRIRQKCGGQIYIILPLL